MGKRNVIFNTYISQNDRFADLFNGILFMGRQVVRPEALTELDSKAWRSNGRKDSHHEYLRDHIKLWEYRGKKVVLGLEPEESVQFALPVKYMNYESIQYDKEYKTIMRQHRRNKDLLSEEYLSGFSQEDQLMPVITLGIYLGNHKWPGFTRLSELTKLNEFPADIRDELLHFSNDFHANLFDVNTLESSDIFQTDLREVLGFLSCQNDKTALRKIVEKDANFQHLKEDAYEVIAAYSNSEELQVRKQEYTNKEGFNMCLAIQEMIADGRAEGWTAGRDEGRAEGRAEGWTAGRTEGKAEINKLIRRLIEDGRMTDLRRMVQDEGYQEQLIKEYGISGAQVDFKPQ